MFKPRSNVNIVKTLTDHKGRYIICNVKIDEIEYTLCNVYAPNNDSPLFFNSLFKVLEKNAKENLIIGGDFNMTLDPNINWLNPKTSSNNIKANHFVQSYMYEHKLCDIWRDRNPEVKRFTWFKSNVSAPLMASRIDYFLLNVGLSGKVKNVNITGCTKTDHSLITLQIKDETHKRGLGIWRLNNKVLKNDKYCSLI